MTIRPTPRSARKRRLCQVLGGVCCLIGIAFGVMWPLSYRYYTTLGIDSEVLKRPGVVYTRYYRIRWPGDGSFRIGGGGFPYLRSPNDLSTPQIFDLGGRFFQSPRLNPPQSVWNRLGFWWVHTGFEAATPHNPYGDVWETWVGVPSWLPILLFFWLTWRLWRSPKRPAITPPPSAGSGAQ